MHCGARRHKLLKRVREMDFWDKWFITHIKLSVGFVADLFISWVNIMLMWVNWPINS